MAKAKQIEPVAPEQPAVAPEQPAVAPEQPRNRPFLGGDANRSVVMVHADHGEAQVGDWQVEEFATLGWSVK
jgi:hypothetical protein